MNRIIYFIAFIVLIAGDAIIGYKSAVNDFRIEHPAAALLFCIAFAFLSFPAKLFYDRLIEAPYKSGSGWGKVPFILFAVAWCALAYKSYEGIIKIRQNSLKVSQLQNFESKQIAATKTGPTPKTDLEYKLERYREFKRSKLDSLQIVSNIANNNRVLAEAIQEAKAIDVSGLFWFNLLLIISGAVVLSYAMNTGEAPTYQRKYFEELGGITARHSFKAFREDLKKKVVDLPKEETNAPYNEDSGQKKPFRCKCLDCGTTYESKQAYAGHFNKKDSTCKKGNVERL